MRDPIAGMRTAHAAYGPFVIQNPPLRVGMYRHPVALAAGARLSRQVLNEPDIWQPINIMYVSPKDGPARRVGLGLFGMSLNRHLHYRWLIGKPLRKSHVESIGGQMAGFATEFTEDWPVDQPFDLWRHVRDLVRNISIGSLFGDDRKHAYPIADLVDERAVFRPSVSAMACPFNIPHTPYGKMVRQSGEIERKIIDWAACKRAPQPDDRDIMSILVNTYNEAGSLPHDSATVGHLPSLFVAAYDTCQTALFWTLVMLSQHPRVARDVADELAPLEGAPLELERVRNLPLLDAVVKETMRLFPPVAMQVRKAMVPTSLNDYPIPERTRVVLSAFVTNRLPALYPEPDRFKPERWETIRPSGYEYAVFSGGPRVCPGQWFGMSALKLALATILTRFRVEVRPDARIDYGIQPTLSPRAAVPAMLKPKREPFTCGPLRGGITRLVDFPA